MSKAKRPRRPSGHPAAIAARRERKGARHEAGPDLTALARRIARMAADFTGPLEAELWASDFAGTFWLERVMLGIGDAHADSVARAMGVPLVTALTRVGGAGACIALWAIGAVDEGDVGMRALRAAQSLAGDCGPLPTWLSEVGAAKIVGAAIMRDEVFDDVRSVLLEARHSGEESHCVGVQIDNNLGGLATDLFLVDSIAAAAQALPPDAPVTLEPVAPGLAAAHIHRALALTDMTWDPPVSEDYHELRALALLAADSTPDLVELADDPDISDEERSRLRDAFLQSPEGRGFAPDGEEAYAVSLAIDFCADYCDGRPLRWSPVVVELFMSWWVPRKVLAGDELLEAMPRALDAWIRYAGRSRGIPEPAIQTTREAIGEWHEEMVTSARDPDLGGPAKQFLLAAKGAGVDLHDPAALDEFMAAWNAQQRLA